VSQYASRYYAAPHVWNLVAKTLREHYALLMQLDARGNKEITARRRTVEDIAMLFAQRFTQDQGFDPLVWLDRCSPDPNYYPFSELWRQDV